jgi:hypothetical protein
MRTKVRVATTTGKKKKKLGQGESQSASRKRRRMEKNMRKDQAARGMCLAAEASMQQVQAPAAAEAFMQQVQAPAAQQFQHHQAASRGPEESSTALLHSQPTPAIPQAQLSINDITCIIFPRQAQTAYDNLGTAITSKIQKALFDSHKQYREQQLTLQLQEQSTQGLSLAAERSLLDFQWQRRESFLNKKLKDASTLGDIVLSSLKHQFIILVLPRHSLHMCLLLNRITEYRLLRSSLTRTTMMTTNTYSCIGTNSATWEEMYTLFSTQLSQRLNLPSRSSMRFERASHMTAR